MRCKFSMLCSFGVTRRRTHIMLSSRKGWVQVPPDSDKDKHFDEYPDLGIEQWHRERKMLQ